MFKQEIVFHNVQDKLPKKNGEYLVIRDSFLGKKFQILNYAKNAGKLFILNDEDIHKKKVWYYSDSEWGDVIMNGILYWAELPKIDLLGDVK